MTHLSRAVMMLTALFFATPAFSVNLLNEPEGIVFDTAYNRYLVSNWRSGAVVQIDSLGEQSYFRTGLGNCASIIIDGDLAYVAVNNNGVVGLDLATGQTVMNVVFAGAGGCHDLAADTSGYLYATDWRNNRIYRVNLGDNSYSIFADANDGVNAPLGIHFDSFENRLIITAMTNNFPIQALYLSDTTVAILINPHLPNLDGITRDQMGNYYISTMASNMPGASNSIYRFDSTFTRSPQLIADGLQGHTDIYFTSHNNILAAAVYWDHDVIYLPIHGYPQIDKCTFLDDLQGDGDGIPEAGETVGLIYQLSNTGIDTVADLRMDLFTDDAAVRIIDGSAVVGDIPQGYTTDNAVDPFIVEIPPDFIARLDSFFVEVNWECDSGMVVDTLAIGVNIGGASVLLVNDDDGSNVGWYYTSCFQSAHIPYDTWSAPPAPTMGDLNNYDIVIWFVGDYRVNPLDNDEISAMKGFLDSGGNLFLTGQRIAAQLRTYDTIFLNEYLHADYVITTVVPLLWSTGGQVFGASDSVYIQGTGGANNQLAPDHLTVINGGMEEFRYLEPSNTGVVSFTGTYRVVFAGFGFEAITSSDGHWTGREIIMREILEFFGYQWPQGTISMVATPGDPMHMMEHSPVFSWGHSDTGFVQQEYQVQVGDDNDWSVPEMWDSGPISGIDTSLPYAGATLSDGLTYYWRVRVSDGVTWSYWYHSDFRMNSIPTSPINLNPDNMQGLVDNPPSLYHFNSQDNEGDSLTYSYEVYDDELLTVLVAQASEIQDNGSGTNIWELPDSLPVENDYFWRVRANDGYEYGEWSQVASFYIISPYICGDVNSDDGVNVGDAVYLVNFVFRSGECATNPPIGCPPEVMAVGDVNGDTNVNIGDVVYLNNFIFNPSQCATNPPIGCPPTCGL